jgi:hypothetical protein
MEIVKAVQMLEPYYFLIYLNRVSCIASSARFVVNTFGTV